METFKTIKNNALAEITEKKSKFIAHIFYVEKNSIMMQGITFLLMLQKLWIGGIAVKYNDDGEPQGTAGSPILKIILEQGLSNILVVVTRYFGGVLLGTGGLVRAYSEATLKALENAEFVEKIIGYKVKIWIEYDSIEQIKYYASKSNFKITNIEYLENIEIIVEIAKDKLLDFTNNNSKIPLKILKYDILEEKYIDRQALSRKIRKNFQKSIAIFCK